MTAPQTLSRFEIIDLLRIEIARAGSLRAYARQHGYSAAYLSDVMRGTRNPGPKVLAPLGVVKLPPAVVEQHYRYARGGPRMIRRSPLPRPTTPIARRVKPKRVNRARQKREKARTTESPDRVKWIGQRPCVACKHRPTEKHPNDGHHIKTGGGSRKADSRFVVPLCRSRLSGFDLYEGCHQVLHRHGRALLEALHGIDLDTAAAETEAAWQSHCGQGQG